MTLTLSVTLLIIVVTAIYSWMAWNNQQVMDKSMLIPAAMQKEGQWYRFLSHGFIHADMMHLFFNMFVLFMFGALVEERLMARFPNGRLIYVALYFGALVFASIPSFLKNRDNYLYRSLGASGAVAAVLFAYILLSNPFDAVYLMFVPIPIPPVVAGILYLVYEGYMAKRGRGNINHDAHIYGAIFGFTFPLLFNPKLILDFIENVRVLIDKVL